MKKQRSLKRLFLFLFGATRKQQIGTAIMVVALACLFYIYYPLIQLVVPVDSKTVHSDSKITIEKINVVSPITWNVDPFNKQEYREVLTEGVAHAKGTAYPAQSGTTYIFAHSSDFPWRLTRYNVIFFRLNELESGDPIVVTYKGHDYIYKVREKKIVSPSQIQYLTKAVRTQLILQTCWPIGTAFQRLLIFADPV